MLPINHRSRKLGSTSDRQAVQPAGERGPRTPPGASSRNLRRAGTRNDHEPFERAVFGIQRTLNLVRHNVMAIVGHPGASRRKPARRCVSGTLC